jgi:hypothetical protein
VLTRLGNTSFAPFPVWESLHNLAAKSATPCLDVGEESDSVAGSDIQADDSASVFSLRWYRTYDGSMALFDSPDCWAVIGCLTVSIPYVAVRGLSFCTEVLRVCASSLNG